MSCPVCYENYSDELKEFGKCNTLLVEDCQHTLCMECLNSISKLPEYQHRCPICREDWEDFIYEYFIADEADDSVNPDYSICAPIFAHMPLHTISIIDAFNEHKHLMTHVINPLIRLSRYDLDSPLSFISRINDRIIIPNNEEDINNLAMDIIRQTRF